MVKRSFPCLEPVVDSAKSTNTTNAKVSIENVPRPFLIFKHNPKAAGGTMEDVLNELKPNQYLRTTLCKGLGKHEIVNNNIDVSSSYLLLKEDEVVPKDARNNGFVISSVREPCDQLISLWAYGSAGKGAFRDAFNNSERLYGKDAPHFDSERDINAFHRWLRDPHVEDLMQERFFKYYLGWHGMHLHRDRERYHFSHNETDEGEWNAYVQHRGNQTKHSGNVQHERGQAWHGQHKRDEGKWNSHVQHRRGHRKMRTEKTTQHNDRGKKNINTKEIPQNVDCWVYVDDFQQTLYTCLKEYENQGGFVDWTTPSLAKIVTDLQEKRLRDEQNYYHRRRRLSVESVEYVDFTKNSIHQNGNQMLHHSKCSKYYDDESADFVRHGSASFIYDMFGYDQCCGTRPIPKNKVILPPLPVQKKLHSVGISLIFFTLFLFALGVVKRVKRHYYYGVKRNYYNQYDQLESQKEK